MQTTKNPEETEEGVKPEVEYWVSFDGIDPTKVGPKILQKLVNSRGTDIKVMSSDQAGGWKSASDFGFVEENRIKDIIAPPPQSPVQDIVTSGNICSLEESQKLILQLSVVSPDAQVSILTVGGRVVAMPLSLASNQVKYLGGRFLRDSVKGG